jgi:hypothetical protein
VKWLLWLYPEPWRRRYRLEMEALLEQTPATPRGLLDLLRGAVDAWLHPPRRPRRDAGWRYLIAVLTLVPPAYGVITLALLVAWPGVAGQHWPWPARLRWGPLVVPVEPLLTTLLLAILAGGLAVAGRLCRFPRLAWFGGLLALRLCFEGGVAPIALAVPSGWRVALLTAFPIAAWSALDALVLRRAAGFRWRRALTAGLGLELLVGPALTAVSGLAHMPTLGAVRWPGAPGLLGEVTWAAVLAVMLARRRSRWNWNSDGQQGAPVPARPLPDAPTALTALRASRGSGRRSDPD